MDNYSAFEMRTACFLSEIEQSRQCDLVSINLNHYDDFWRDLTGV